MFSLIVSFFHTTVMTQPAHLPPISRLTFSLGICLLLSFTLAAHILLSHLFSYQDWVTFSFRVLLLFLL
jgi:hypothetical protein